LVVADAVAPRATPRKWTVRSSTSVAWVGVERAKRESTERSRMTVTCISPLL